MKQDFKKAAMQTVQMGENATAYVFYPDGDRKAMRFTPENVRFESSDGGLIGNERHEVDCQTKSPEDCVLQAEGLVTKMPQDGQPKVVVFVHEPQRFHFNDHAVATQLQSEKDKPQSLFRVVLDRVMPKHKLA